MSEVLLSSEYFREELEVSPNESGVFLSGFSKMVVSRFPAEEGYVLPGNGQITNEYRKAYFDTEAVEHVTYQCGSVSKLTKCEKHGTFGVGHHYCYKASCPICYPAWALQRAEYQGMNLFALMQLHPVYHWVISFDHHESIPEMKKQIKRFFPSCFAMFHPYRLQDEEGRSHIDKDFDVKTAKWRMGRHWHVQTWVEYLPTKELYEKEKILLKRVERVHNSLDDAMRLLAYEMSHVALEVKQVKRFREMEENGSKVQEEYLSQDTYAVITALGEWSNCRIGKLIARIDLTDVNVKCHCEECQKEFFQEDRADQLAAKVHLEEYNIQKLDGMIACLSKFRQESEFVFDKKEQRIAIPWEMQSDFNQYLYMLGVTRQKTQVLDFFYSAKDPGFQRIKKRKAEEFFLVESANGQGCKKYQKV